jgi:hypothetical protein
LESKPKVQAAAEIAKPVQNVKVVNETAKSKPDTSSVKK